MVDVDDFTFETLDAAARPQKSKNMHSFSARLSRISSSVTPKLGSKILGIGVKNVGQTLIPFLVCLQVLNKWSLGIKYILNEKGTYVPFWLT